MPCRSCSSAKWPNKPLQILLNKPNSPPQKVVTRGAHPVVLVRVYQQFEILIGTHQLLNHLIAVLDMDIVVARTVRQQQFSFEQAGK